MNKKLTITLLLFAVIMSIVALVTICSNNELKKDIKIYENKISYLQDKIAELEKSSNDQNDNISNSNDANKDNQTNADTTDDENNNILEKSEERVTNVITNLNNEWTSIKDQINTYEEYVENYLVIKSFYEKIQCEVNKLCNEICIDAYDYTENIIHSNISINEMGLRIDELNSFVCEDLLYSIEDKIYNKLLNEILDEFYYGILAETDYVDYSELYDYMYKEYDNYYDCAFAVYDQYYDAGVYVYNLYYKISAKLYMGDLSGAKECLNELKLD